MNINEFREFIEKRSSCAFNSNVADIIYSEILEKLDEVEKDLLKNTLTLSEVSNKYHVSIETLRYRLKNLEEGTDYRKTEGNKQPIILTPTGIKKLVKGCSSYIVLRDKE